MSLRHSKKIGRKRRQERVRKTIQGTDGCPRLCVYRSLKHIYAQVITDETGKTLASASTLSAELKDKLDGAKGVEAARLVGLTLARQCKEKDINRVIFDRNGFLYHGRVKALAEAARDGGLVF
ncbi:MAG: 50S ribosomal protein L18 [Deltaproteobacteria bacterium]|nr:50S ribosomal protein L18 [Deltaproteobacteria bacterium]